VISCSKNAAWCAQVDRLPCKGGFDLHRISAQTAVFLWSLLAAAAVVGFWMRDPQGAETALAIQAESLPQPAGLITLQKVSVASLVLGPAVIK
jgi:hypothetical protein